MINLKKYFPKLTSKDLKNVNYCKFKIHGLSFRPLPGEKRCLNDDRLMDFVARLYENHSTESQYVIGYKGGNVERDILNQLGIPNVNIEDFNCPKYNYLPKVTISDCGFHLPLNNYHCPKLECYAFSLWVKNAQNSETCY